MQRKMKLGLALFFTVFVAPVWAHHAAEGIISDDIWEMIDDNLEVAESPHLNIDFDDIMDSMRVGDSENGAQALITEYTVRVDDYDDYMTEITEIVDGWLVDMVDDGTLSPAILQDGHGSWFYFELVDEDPLDDVVEIRLVEPIGNGSGEYALDPPEYPGQGSGGSN